MPKNNDCFAVYSRKSKFTGKGESIGNQVEFSREYIRTHYGDSYANDIIVYEDEGFSGGNLNRPGFKRMMKAARERKLKAIVVYRLDRISRNVSDFSTLIEELSKLDVAFVSIREQFDTGTPMGRAMMYIASVFSQLERETIAERIRDNMQELAKTGRWLGGVTPTGYASESIKSITVDGKSKKACKLKLIPEEADIVKMIYQLYIETDSLTITEAELMKRGIKTKNGHYHTRFSIKAILQNPVYVIADQDTCAYFKKMDADLFFGEKSFDGIHGILAYNRTDQEKGRAAKRLPVSEWIVAVGAHRGIVPGKIWVSVQESLERNKSKTYRKARSNEALLTGLLYCSCGSRMYPKLSKRRREDEPPVCTYVCNMKERSRHSICNVRNAEGNIMDAAIVEHIKYLEDDQRSFIDRLEQTREFCAGGRTDIEEQLAALRRERTETERKIAALVDSLAELGENAAKTHVSMRIEQLHQAGQDIELRIQELDGLTPRRELNDIEFDGIQRSLSVFRFCVDEMSVEQKRAAIRALVRKVVWDGVNAHVILFGAADGEIECPESAADGNEDIGENENLGRFSDAAYDDNDRAQQPESRGAAKTHRGEDSK